MSRSSVEQGSVQFVNNNSGIVNFSAPGTVLIDTSEFSNAGQLNVNDGGAQFNENINQTAGATDLLGGMLRVYGQLIIGAGSSLTGTGTLNMWDLINAGTIAPGRPASPTGSLQLFALPNEPGSGNFRQQATGTLSLKIVDAAAQYNRLIVGGTASLAGTLAFTYVAPYAPAPGNVVDPVTWSTLDANANSFATIPAGWTAQYQAGQLELRRPARPQAGGMAWNDTNGDGTRQGTEAALVGVTVNLLDGGMQPASP